ncbi:MAG: SDR family oxidoreductase [Gammaproteobacteria bacterium]
MSDINYKGLFFTIKYALDYLNDHASIILISSVAGNITVKNHSVYSSTKAAVRKLAQNFSLDLSDRFIRVNSISPGVIENPIFAERLEDDPEVLNKRAQKIPLQRVGQPGEIANAALFLGSDEASYITGTDLIVDGGCSALFEF